MNDHESAKELILVAAEQSGLLAEVEKLIAWWNKPGEKPFGVGCPICDLRETLTDGFDQFICDPAIAVENVYGEGCCFEPQPQKGEPQCS